MRYDNMFWVLIAPALASCACFAFEMFSSPTGSWNDRFEDLRRGFEMVGGKEKPRNTQVALHDVPATHRTSACMAIAEQKRTS